MYFIQHRIVRAISILLIVATITQSVYTALYVAEMDVPRQLLWGTEGLLFPLLAAFAGLAMVRSKQLGLAYAAIAFGAVLNLVQVGVGLTLFFPFGDAAKADPALAPLAGAVVAFAFFIYNAAKLLLGFAALLVGLSRMSAGSKILGGATVLVGGIAMIANGAAIVGAGEIVGRIAGGSGVLATLLLAVSLLGAGRED
jgi:hypothetical protein